ncbi:MAG TPA: Gfo/Idh/MocA family oxidoreductase [Alphaproteobacteria bacterium]|nr:Gfo/Idh/MocA family oxidoreductase [Alphaproteobacteria bacterium]
MAALRVGLIGAGMISPYHLTAWSRLQQAKVVAICDPDRARAEERAKAFGIQCVHTDAAAMLANEKLDAVDIASPRECHAEHVRQAAARGLAVLCQKPLTPTLEEAEALVAEVGARSRLMVHENWRFRPNYRQAKRWLDEGRVGTIRGARMVMRASGFLPDVEGKYPSLVRQPFMAKERRLFVAESFIHQMDVMRWLVGPMRVVAARLGRVCPAVIGEDSAVIVAATPDGVLVTMDGDGAAPGYPARSSEELEIVGTRCTLRFADLKLRLSGAESASIAYDRDEIYQASFDACIRHFVECLESGAAFETAPADNLETLRLVEDTYRLAGPIRDLVRTR